MKIKKINKFLKRILGEHTMGITLAPRAIYIRENCMDDEILINHESIHWKQQIEMLIIPFYILYLLEWLIKGYYNISFEREAYYNDENLDYLKTRKFYSWTKYFKFTKFTLK